MTLLAFGELLLRLEPEHGQRLVQADSFDVRFTGAEANVAASLSGFGVPSAVLSAVPDDAMGDACLSFIRRFGVDTSRVVRRPGRLGLFYYEREGVGRPSHVIYDRTGSAFATCDPTAYDWPALLADCSWLHVSGTAPALGPSVYAALQQGLATAVERGVRVSLDLNYRRSLWSIEEAGLALRPLLGQVDVLLGSGEDAARVLGVAGSADDEIASRLRETYGLTHVAGTTRRLDGQGRPQLSGVLVDGDGVHRSQDYPLIDAVGRIGTGDAFSAGILRGLLLDGSADDSVDFAAAAAHLKQSVQGDVNVVTCAEVEQAIRDPLPDRVQR